MNIAESPSSLSDSSRRSNKNVGCSQIKGNDIFQSRKNSFLRSLKAAIQNISNDQMIAQMFEDPKSALYIPDRVVEIIQETLEDDRENLIMSLLQQNNEANIDPIEIQHFLTATKNSLKSLSNELEQTKRFVNYTFKKQFINNEIENARMQVNAFVTASLSGRYVSNTNTESLQKQVNFISKKFFEIDLPNLRSKYENEIKSHIENESEQQKMISSLTRQIEKLRKESNSLTEKLSKSEKTIEHFREKVDSLREVQKQLEVAKNQIKAMQKELEKKNKAVGFYISEKSNEDSVSLNFSRLQMSYSGLKKKYEEIENENSKLKEALSKKSLSQSENDHINSIHQANLQILKTQNASIPQLESELQKSMRHAKSLEITNIEIAKRLDKSLKENSELYKKIDQLKDEISGASNDRTNKAELRSEIELLNEELAAAKKQINDLDSNVFELSQNNQKLKREIDSKSSSLDKSMLDFSSQKSKFQNTLAESETKVAFLTSKLQEYESSIHFNMKQLRQKELQINELTQSKKELEEMSTKLKSKLEARESEYQQASISYEQSSEAYLYAQAELKQKESIINKLMAADEISKQQKEKMSDKIEENNLMIQKLNGSIHELSNEREKMQNKIDEKEITIDELNGKIKENDDKLIEKDNLLTKMNASNQSLRKSVKKLEISKTNNEKIISTLREQIVESEKEISQHKESIQFLKSEIQKLQNEKKDLQKKISDDSIAFEARLNQVDKEKILLTKKQTETELKLKSSIEECKSLTDKYNKSLEDFDKLTNENKQIQNNSAQKQNSLMEEIEKLKQSNSIMLSKFDNLLQQANEVVKIKRIHDIPGVLKKLKEKCDRILEDDNKTRKILKTTEFESIPETIQKIKDDRIRLLKFESKIRKVVGNFDTDFILQTIQNSLEIQNGLSLLFKKQTSPSEYYEIIKGCFLKLQEYEEREIVLDSLFTNKNKKSAMNSIANDESSLSISGLNEETAINYNKDTENGIAINKDLPNYISTMQNMYRDSHHVVKKLCRLFEIRNQDEIPTRVSILLTQIRELKSILNIDSDATSNTSANSPNKNEKVNYEESVSKAANDLVDQLKEAKKELRSIYKLFDPSNDVYNFTNIDGNDVSNLPINKQIEHMQNENKKLRYILNSASEVINQNESFDLNQIGQTESEVSINLNDSSKSPIKATSPKNSKNSPLSKKSKTSLKKSSAPLTNSVYLSSPLSRQPIDADFILKCQQLKKKIELLENQQKEVERALPNISNNFSRIRGLDETDNNSTNLVLIGSLPDRVRQMANRYNNYYNQVNECQKIFTDANKSYININGNLPGAVSMILTRIEEYERQERMIKSILEESSAFNFTGNIQETISELVQKNLDLTLTFQQLNGIVFASKDDVNDNLVITVDRIVKERLEYQKMIDEYSEILSGKNISQKITLLLQNDSFLAKLKQLLECESNDDLFAKVKNSRVLLKKIIALIPSSIKAKSSQINSRSQSKSKSKSNTDDSMIIDEPELLEKLSHFQDYYDFRREIFDRFNSAAQTLQPLDSANSSLTMSDSDSDSNLIASTHRKKINARLSQPKTQKTQQVNQNQFESDQELFKFIDDQSTELLVLRKMKDELDSILPHSVEGSIPEKASQIVKQCLLYQRQYSALKKLIPSEYHGSLSSKVEQLTNTLKKYQAQQAELTKIVNEDQFSTTETDTENISENGSTYNNEQVNLKIDDSLVSDITQIKRKSEEVSKDLYIINQLIPEEFVGNSERERIVMLIDEFNKQKLVIQSISSSLDKNTSSLVNSTFNSIEKEVEKAVTKNEDLLNEKIEALKLLDSTHSNQELIPLLKKTIQEKKVQQTILAQLRKLLNCSDDEVIERIKELSKESKLFRNIYQEMNHNDSQIKESDLIKKIKELNENSRVLNLIESTIPEDIKPYNNSNSTPKNEIDVNSSRLNLLQAKIAILIESYKEKHDTIHKLNLNDNLTDSVSQLLIEKEELTQALSAIQNILSKSPAQSSFLDNEENEQNSSDLSIGSRQMIVSQVSNLVNSLQQSNSVIAQINEKLSDFPGDINTKLNEVLRQNYTLQKMQSDLLSLLPENLSGNLIERVSQLCSEFANLENQQVAISRNIPIEFSSAQNGQSVYDKVGSLQQDYSVQRKAIQRIQKMLLQNQYLHRNCSTIDSIADCVEEILNQNSHLIQMQKNINNKFGIFGKNKLELNSETENNEFENEEDLSALLMNSIDETFNTIDKLKAENLELKESMNELREISNHSDLNEFMKKSLKDKKVIKRIIDLLDPNNKNENGKSNNAFALVQETVFELNRIREEQNEIVSILSDLDENIANNKKNEQNSNDESLANQIGNLISALTNQGQLLNDMNHQIPQEIKGESIFVRFSGLLKKYNEQKALIRKASTHLESNNNNNQTEKEGNEHEDNKALIEQIQMLTKTNQNLLKERAMIIDSLPLSFKQFEYPDSVLNLSSELQKGGSFLNSISNIFKKAEESRPSSPKPVKKLQKFEKDANIGINEFASLPSQVELALEERNELLKYKLRLIQQLNSEDVFDEIDRLMNVDSQLKFVSEKIPKAFEGNGIEKRIQIFNNEFQRKNSLINKIDDTLPGSGDLVKRAQSLRDEDEEMKRVIQQLNHIMSNELFEGTTLLEKVSNVAKRYQSVNNYLNTTKSKSIDLSEEAMKLSLMNKKSKEKISRISKVLTSNNLLEIDNDENYILEDRIEEICEELIKLREQLQFIDSEASSSTSMKKVIKQKSIVNLPGNEAATARKVGLLIQTNNQLEQQINSIKNVLDNHFSDESSIDLQKSNLSIEDQISTIIKENYELKSQMNSIEDGLNKVKGNDIFEKMNQLQIELKKSKERITNISNLIPDEFDNPNIETNLEDLVKSYQSNNTYLSNIDRIVPDLESDIAFNSAPNSPNSNLKSNKSFMKNLVNEKIQSKVSKIVQQNHEMLSLWDKVYKTFPSQFKDKKDLIERIGSLLQQQENLLEILKSSELILNAHFRKENNIDNLNENRFISIPENITNLINENETMKSTLDEINITIPSKLSSNQNNQEYLINVESLVRKYKDLGNRISQIDQLLHINNELITHKRNEFEDEDENEDINSKSIEERIAIIFKELKASQEDYKRLKKSILLNNKSSDSDEVNPVETLESIIQKKEKMTLFASHLVNMIPEQFKGSRNIVISDESKFSTFEKMMTDFATEFGKQKKMIAGVQTAVSPSKSTLDDDDDDQNENNKQEMIDHIQTVNDELIKAKQMLPPEFKTQSDFIQNLTKLVNTYNSIKSLFNINNNNDDILNVIHNYIQNHQQETEKPTKIHNVSNEFDQSQIEKEKEHLYEILDAIQKEIPEEIINENKIEFQDNEEEEEENVEENLSMLLKNVEKFKNRYQMFSNQLNQIKEKIGLDSNIENLADDLLKLFNEQKELNNQISLSLSSNETKPTKQELSNQISLLISKKEKLEKIETILKKSTVSNESIIEEEEEEIDDNNVEEKIIQLLSNQSSLKSKLQKLEENKQNSPEFNQLDKIDGNDDQIENISSISSNHLNKEEEEKKEKESNVVFDEDRQQDSKDLSEIANFLEESNDDNDNKEKIDSNQFKEEEEKNSKIEIDIDIDIENQINQNEEEEKNSKIENVNENKNQINQNEEEEKNSKIEIVNENENQINQNEEEETESKNQVNLLFEEEEEEGNTLSNSGKDNLNQEEENHNENAFEIEDYQFASDGKNEEEEKTTNNDNNFDINFDESEGN